MKKVTLTDIDGNLLELNNDTKNTAGSEDIKNSDSTQSPLYLIGTCEQSEYSKTYSNGSVYIDEESVLHSDVSIQTDNLKVHSTDNEQSEYSNGAEGQCLMTNGSFAYWGTPSTSSSSAPLRYHVITSELVGGIKVSFNFMSSIDTKVTTIFAIKNTFFPTLSYIDFPVIINNNVGFLRLSGTSVRRYVNGSSTTVTSVNSFKHNIY